MRLSFHGASRGVTGSCHLVETHGLKLLVDCGLFQGRHESEDNATPFGFEPESIDAVLLTHAHLDHCGRLPLLVKQGFRGEIIATAATRDLARIVLVDAAELQREDSRHGERGSRMVARGPEHAGGPLYSVSDALSTLDRFGRNAAYGHPMRLSDHVTVTYLDAGHILGSANVVVEVVESGRTKRLLFSGDVGNAGRPLLRDPERPPECDVVVLETTYGDRLHRSIASSVEELHDAIAATFVRGGNVVIPTFALERAQEILFFLRLGIESGRLPPRMQVFLDSPMAISATEIFRRHPECYDEETTQLFAAGRDPFGLPGLHFTRQTVDSIALNQIVSGAVIMAGSGMCTGGRVRHHLRHNLPREHSSVIFVGYAATGTLAREIIDGAARVEIYHHDVPVRARIHTINGFSAHADQAELLAWHASAGASARTFLVHGEEEAMATFARRLGTRQVDMPQLYDAFDL